MPLCFVLQLLAVVHCFAKPALLIIINILAKYREINLINKIGFGDRALMLEEEVFMETMQAATTKGTVTLIRTGQWRREKFQYSKLSECTIGQPQRELKATTRNSLLNSGWPTQPEGWTPTSIVLILTLPKFHLTTWNNSPSSAAYQQSKGNK